MRISESKFRQIVRNELLSEMGSKESNLRLVNNAVEGVKVYGDLSDPTRLLFVFDDLEKMEGVKDYLESIENMGIFSHSSYDGVNYNIFVPNLSEGHIEIRCFPEACSAVENSLLRFITKR